ncbi:microtubule-associated protein 70-5-like [Chenopodium quinoa]|uniref:microtubule-associated protein 70-5-like n=1 Tax=Chenopodium quinoa TaxID=63459 RepID=UPI000B76CBDB|nr:microtubule-associated protein 70-5-like [Chenopodium quinoa]
MMLGMEDLSFISQPQPDPVVLELNHLQNQLKEKDNDLCAAQNEIKALRATQAHKEKALDELKTNYDKLDEKLRVTENALQQKNLEMKKLADEKKDALAAQFAAEAALRRLHTNQKDDDYIPIDSIIAPLEADIKMYKNEIASLLEDKKAMERLTKSKETALLETEKILRSALERAFIVEDVQNQNLELRRQIEICLEENKILEKTNRLKVVEVEKLSQTIQELEEAVLAGGATANVVREYKRKISELNEEKRTLERELARARVSANRVATVVANEWKDENDKVMPVKQWLEERRVLQAEMQRLKDKLAVAERTAKAEAQLKEKFKLRLKTLEEGLKHASSNESTPKNTNSNRILGFVSNNTGPRKRSSSQPRGSVINSRSSPLHQPWLEKVNSLENHNSKENIAKRSLWGIKTTNTDRFGKENSELVANTDVNTGLTKDSNSAVQGEMESKEIGSEDAVSGFLYDRLQKEVINLRKICQAKDDGLDSKDEEIKILLKKVDTLTKAIEVEARKAKKETSAGQKAIIPASKDENKKNWSKAFLKRVTKS